MTAETMVLPVWFQNQGSDLITRIRVLTCRQMYTRDGGLAQRGRLEYVCKLVTCLAACGRAAAS